MSTVPNAVASVPVVPAPAAPASKPTAIERIEQEVAAWFRQKEQMIENIKSIDGAIQGGQRLAGILKAEAVKAEAEAEKLAGEAKAEIEKLASEAKAL